MDIHQKIAVVVVIGSVLYCIILWFFFYTIEGDILTPFKNCPSHDDLREKYHTTDDIADRLHKLAIYKRYEVLWPFTLLGSMLSAYLILVAMNHVCIRNFIVCFTIIFVTIDLSRRWVDCHRHGGIEIEATLLYSRFRQLNKKHNRH